MTKKYLYIAKGFQDLCYDQQEQLFSSIEFDAIIVEDQPTINQPHRAWSGLTRLLRDGDILAVASLSIFTFKMPVLNKHLYKLVNRGISIQIGVPNLLISPDKSDPAFQLMTAYNLQVRFIMSRDIRRGLAASFKSGRPSQLTLKQLPEIKKMMSDPSLTMQDISSRLGVSRSTIYKFISKAKSAK